MSVHPGSKDSLSRSIFPQPHSAKSAKTPPAAHPFCQQVSVGSAPNTPQDLKHLMQLLETQAPLAAAPVRARLAELGLGTLKEQAQLEALAKPATRTKLMCAAYTLPVGHENCGGRDKLAYTRCLRVLGNVPIAAPMQAEAKQTTQIQDHPWLPQDAYLEGGDIMAAPQVALNKLEIPAGWGLWAYTDLAAGGQANPAPAYILAPDGWMPEQASSSPEWKKLNDSSELPAGKVSTFLTGFGHRTTPNAIVALATRARALYVPIPLATPEQRAAEPASTEVDSALTEADRALAGEVFHLDVCLGIVGDLARIYKPAIASQHSAAVEGLFDQIFEHVFAIDGASAQKFAANGLLTRREDSKTHERWVYFFPKGGSTRADFEAMRDALAATCPPGVAPPTLSIKTTYPAPGEAPVRAYVLEYARSEGRQEAGRPARTSIRFEPLPTQETILAGGSVRCDTQRSSSIDGQGPLSMLLRDARYFTLTTGQNAMEDAAYQKEQAQPVPLWQRCQINHAHRVASLSRVLPTWVLSPEPQTQYEAVFIRDPIMPYLRGPDGRAYGAPFVPPSEAQRFSLVHVPGKMRHPVRRPEPRSVLAQLDVPIDERARFGHEA